MVPEAGTIQPKNRLQLTDYAKILAKYLCFVTTLVTTLHSDPMLFVL